MHLKLLHASQDYRAQGERAHLLTMQILYPPLLSVFFLFDDCLFNNHFQFLWHFNGAESLTTTTNDFYYHFGVLCPWSMQDRVDITVISKTAKCRWIIVTFDLIDQCIFIACADWHLSSHMTVGTQCPLWLKVFCLVRSS